MSTICNLAEQLKKAGYKLTPARRAVIEVLETEVEHPSHQQILEEGQKIYPKLSRATVYRTMELLVELRLVRPLYLNDPTQRFVSATGGHHHLVCSSCGKIFEFDQCTVDQLATELSGKYNFEIFSHLLEFHGLCETCQ
jgi:Fur family ferric uptake transcriptional regulator